jgi:hypothetical protein
MVRRPSISEISSVDLWFKAAWPMLTTLGYIMNTSCLMMFQVRPLSRALPMPGCLPRRNVSSKKPFGAIFSSSHLAPLMMPLRKVLPCEPEKLAPKSVST